MHLTKEQSDRFGAILAALVVYANETRHIVTDEKLLNLEEGFISPEANQQILQVIWDVPEIIDDFVEANPFDLKQADLKEVQSWKHRLSGPQILVGFDEQGCALISLDEAIVAVCGPGPTWRELIDDDVPKAVYITLLPFEGVVTFDATIGVYEEVTNTGVVSRACEAEVAAMPGKPVISTAKEFIAVAEEERSHLRQIEIEEMEREVEHERIELGGAEDLPEGVHRGVLAGLSERERARMIEQAADAEAAARALSGVEGASPAGDALQDIWHVEKCAPVTSLAESLALDSRDVLEYEAFMWDIEHPEDMKKPKLARKVARAMVKDKQGLEEFALRCSDACFATFRQLLEAPQASYTFSAEGLDEHRDLEFWYPYTQVFLHKGIYSALVPDELREAYASFDIEAIAQRRRRARDIAHAARVLCEFCGVVPLEDVCARVEELYGFTASVDEVRDVLERSECSQSEASQLELWEGDDDEPRYVVHFLLSDRRAALEVMIQSLEDSGADPADALLGGLGDGLDFSRIDFDKIDIKKNNKLFKRALIQCDGNIRALIGLHEGRKDLGPCPIDSQLATIDVSTWEAASPRALNLRAWLDAHVPDDADDLTFADEALQHLLGMRRASPNVNVMLDVAKDMGLFELTSDRHALGGRIAALANTLPNWALNGWTPLAVREHDERRRIFLNPDGSEAKVGRNDPCPCGSGKKYKKCCGR